MFSLRSPNPPIRRTGPLARFRAATRRGRSANGSSGNAANTGVPSRRDGDIGAHIGVAFFALPTLVWIYVIMVGVVLGFIALTLGLRELGPRGERAADRLLDWWDKFVGDE